MRFLLTLIVRELVDYPPRGQNRFHRSPRLHGSLEDSTCGGLVAVV